MRIDNLHIENFGKLQNLDLNFNEELTVTIENNKEKIEPKKEKSYSERITKLPVTGMWFYFGESPGS